MYMAVGLVKDSCKDALNIMSMDMSMSMNIMSMEGLRVLLRSSFIAY